MPVTCVLMPRERTVVGEVGFDTNRQRGPCQRFRIEVLEHAEMQVPGFARSQDGGRLREEIALDLDLGVLKRP